MISIYKILAFREFPVDLNYFFVIYFEVWSILFNDSEHAWVRKQRIAVVIQKI